MVPDGPKTSSCRMQTDSGGVKDKNDAIDERTDVSADSRDSAAEHEILQKIEDCSVVLCVRQEHFS